MSKKVAVWICICLLTAVFAGCSTSGDGGASVSLPPEVDISSDAQPKTSTETAEPDTAIVADTEVEEGSIRFYFTFRRRVGISASGG